MRGKLCGRVSLFIVRMQRSQTFTFWTLDGHTISCYVCMCIAICLHLREHTAYMRFFLELMEYGTKVICWDVCLCLGYYFLTLFTISSVNGICFKIRIGPSRRYYFGQLIFCCHKPLLLFQLYILSQQ